PLPELLRETLHGIADRISGQRFALNGPALRAHWPALRAHWLGDGPFSGPASGGGRCVRAPRAGAVTAPSARAPARPPARARRLCATAGAAPRVGQTCRPRDRLRLGTPADAGVPGRTERTPPRPSRPPARRRRTTPACERGAGRSIPAR